MEVLPLISIIIPVYNVNGYLEKCLHSVCEQTYKNLEIIVVDDGSTDGSGEICDLFAETDSRIKVIHQANGGQVVHVTKDWLLPGASILVLWIAMTGLILICTNFCIVC